GLRARRRARPGGVRGVQCGGRPAPRSYTLILFLELGLIDLIEGDLVGDGPARQPGEPGRPADVAAGALQGAAGVALLEAGGQLVELVGQGAREVDRELDLGPARLEDLGREVLRTNHVVARGHGGALDGVLQLADVAGPPVLE